MEQVDLETLRKEYDYLHRKLIGVPPLKTPANSQELNQKVDGFMLKILDALEKTLDSNTELRKAVAARMVTTDHDDMPQDDEFLEKATLKHLRLPTRTENALARFPGMAEHGYKVSFLVQHRLSEFLRKTRNFGKHAALELLYALHRHGLALPAEVRHETRKRNEACFTAAERVYMKFHEGL